MAIINIPTANHFEQAAKTAFFAGWNDLLHLISDFELHREREPDAAEDWDDERKRYYAHCKVELEKVCSWAGQATELALKAKICARAPTCSFSERIKGLKQLAAISTSLTFGLSMRPIFSPR